MAEGSDDPEGEESPEWFLPPNLSYIVSARLNMPELREAHSSSHFCFLSCCVCMLWGLSFKKGEGKRNVRHGRNRRAGTKRSGWKLRAHAHRYVARRGRAGV